MSSGELPTVKPVRRWTGQFIWCEGEAKPYHFYLFARRSFELDSRPQGAELHITTSDRYALYVNGTYLGRGPARSDPRRKSYDTYEVAEHLQPGKNTIAVRAYHYGAANLWGEGWGSRSGNAWTVGERAGLWAQLDLTTGGGQSEVIGTDDTWRVSPARAWARTAKPIDPLSGSTEVYDANADPVDWMATDFDDSGWDRAWVIPQPDLEWFLLEPRETPLMEERETFPVRIIKVGEVIDQARPGQVDIPELLQSEVHLPLEHAQVKNPDGVLRNDGQPAVFQGKDVEEKGIRAPCIILDFGRQLFGFPRVRLSAEKGAMLDMACVQQLVDGRIRLGAGTRFGDRYIARQGRQTWELAEYKQFRYLQLMLRSAYAPIRIESVSVNEYRYPAKQRGKFSCSDPFLNRLWKASMDTMYLHLEDTVVCDACRERAQWMSEGGCHDLVIFAAYGDLVVTDRLLRSIPLSDRGDGALQMVYPPNDPDRFNIAALLLEWSDKVAEHYLFTGRKTLLRELYQSVQRQIDWYEPYRDDMGLLHDLPGWHMLDWAANDCRGAGFTTNARYVRGLENAAWLADHMERAEDAQRWRQIARELRPVLREVFWNDEKGLYEDSFYQGSRTGVVSELANACALLYGIATEEQVPRIAQHFTPQPADSDLVVVSPLPFGVVLEALMHVGMVQRALDLMRTRFAFMLDSTDNPTLWENWWPFSRYDARDDDAVGYEAFLKRNVKWPVTWQSVVISSPARAGYVLSSRVLGVMPTGPGFSSCTVHPHTGDLEWAKGTFPAPQGDIRVEWKKENGSLALTTEIPEGVQAEVVLDRDPQARQALTHNGARVDMEELHALAQAGVTVEPAAIRIGVVAGRHTIELSRPSTER